MVRVRVRVRVRVMVRVMVRAMVRAMVRVRVRVLFLIVVSLGYSSVQRVKRRGQIPSLPTVLPADGRRQRGCWIWVKCPPCRRTFRRQRGPSAWRG